MEGGNNEVSVSFYCLNARRNVQAPLSLIRNKQSVYSQ